jgi:hypothetical protein
MINSTIFENSEVTFQRPYSRPYFYVISSADGEALVSSLESRTACNFTRFPFILVEGKRRLSWFPRLVRKTLCPLEGCMVDRSRALEAMALEELRREATLAREHSERKRTSEREKRIGPMLGFWVYGPGEVSNPDPKQGHEFMIMTHDS